MSLGGICICIKHCYRDFLAKPTKMSCNNCRNSTFDCDKAGSD